MKENTNWDIFHDEELNIQFAKNGYQILTINSPKLLEELSYLFKTVSSKYQSGFTATLLISDASHRRLIHEKISDLLESTIQHYFKSYRQICSGFAVKKGNEQRSEMPLHQDISMLQPGGRPALSFWFPLVPTNARNGNLQVVPESHLYYRHERAAGTPFPLLNMEKKLRAHYLKSLPTENGQVIVIDQTLFHASPPNMSDTDRVVATSVLLPEEKSTFYYFRKTDVSPVELEAYMVQDDFYFDHQLGTRPKDILLNHSLREQPPSNNFSLFPELVS